MYLQKQQQCKSALIFFLTEKPEQEKSIEQNRPSCTFDKGQFSDLTIIRDIKSLWQAVKKIANCQGLCENLDIDEGTTDHLIYSNDQPVIKKSNY